MLRMKASAVIRKEAIGPSQVHSAARTSRSKRTWSVWVGVKAVKSCVPGSAAAQAAERLAVEAVRPPEGAAALEGVGGGPGEHPVAVGARGGVAAGVEAVGRRGGGGDRDVVRADPVQPPGAGLRHLGLGGEARDLAAGVDPRVGAARDGQLDRLAQDRLEGGLQLPLHRAQPGLPRPAREPGAVVFDVEADASATQPRAQDVGRAVDPDPDAVARVPGGEAEAPGADRAPGG